MLTFGVCGAVGKSSGGFHAQATLEAIVIVESYLIVVVAGRSGWGVMIIVDSLVTFVLKFYLIKLKDHLENEKSHLNHWVGPWHSVTAHSPSIQARGVHSSIE